MPNYKDWGLPPRGHYTIVVNVLYFFYYLQNIQLYSKNPPPAPTDEGTFTHYGARKQTYKNYSTLHR